VEAAGQDIETFMSTDQQNLLNSSQSATINSDAVVQGLLNQVLDSGGSQSGLAPLMSAMQQVAGGTRPIGLVLRQSTPLGFGALSAIAGAQSEGDDAFIENQMFGGMGSSFEDLLHHLLMNEPSHGGSSPASTEAIERLERRTDHLTELGDCSISQEPFTESDVAIILPCGHAYREQLILKWLRSHNTCPVCRVSL
jgi:hypothetical protein